MTKYDAIIILASQPDTVTWKFPQQIYDCLDRGIQLLNQNIAPFIITSGKWSISIDNQELTQPFRECDALATYLIQKEVLEDKILKEGDSKDTVSNLYYLKVNFLIPKNIKHILFVVARFRIPRLQFLCERILGNEYIVEFDPIECDVGKTYNEPHTFDVQKKFLEPMKTGDHTWLADKFYTAPMYQYWAQHDKEKYHDHRSGA